MKPTLDYVRFATWKTAAYAEVMAQISRDYPLDGHKSNFLQYRGTRYGAYGQLFAGRAMQAGKEHYIIHNSGFTSHDFYAAYDFDWPWYCTRIDLEVTLPMPSWFYDDDFEAQLAAMRDITEISSPSGRTVYFGKRTSGRMVRLYTKTLDDTRYLRCELELKKSYAQIAHQILGAPEQDNEELRIYQHHLEAMQLPYTLREYFTGNSSPTDENIGKLLKRKEADNRLGWFQSIVPGIERMMMDHDIGSTTRAIIFALNEIATIREAGESAQ